VNGNETLEKAKKEIKSNIIEVEHKLKSYADHQTVLVKDEMTKFTRNSVDILRTDISKDFTAVQLKILDIQNQRSTDMKDIQNEIKYLHERISESIDENRLKIKQFSEEFNEKLIHSGETSTHNVLFLSFLPNLINQL